MFYSTAHCRSVKNSINGVVAGLDSSAYEDSLLVICFILLLAEILWLGAYCCCWHRYNTQLNILAVMLAIIELVVVGFIAA